MKKNLFIFALATFTLVGCGNKNTALNPDKKSDEESTVVDETKVTGVALSLTSLSMLEAKPDHLYATVKPSTALNQNVRWSSSNPMIVSVDENGNLFGLNVGSAVITVTTEEGGYTASCKVYVENRQDDREIKDSKFDFNAQGYSSDSVAIDGSFTFGGEFKLEFAANGGTDPKIYKYNKLYAARAYAKNTVTLSSETTNIVKVQFTFDPNKDGDNPITANTGTFVENTWVGESKNVVFTIGGESGYRAFNDISVSYVGEVEDNPDITMNLGTKTIQQVKEYILANPIAGNAQGNWVNKNRYVTIKGLAVARIDTVKDKASYGLDLTESAKVIIADETGYIGCASKTGIGNLWYKVADYACKNTSKYSVCGYLSYIQGHPELKIISYEYTPDLDLDFNASSLSTKDVDIDGFYDEAVTTNYNCAGHGYGEAITLKNVYCNQYEADGQGKRYYWFTDGVKQMRVNAYNMPSVSVGGCYDITGIISFKNYSPIIVAWDIKSNSSAPAFKFDYESAAETITAANLNKLCPPQDDTTIRQPESIRAFSKFYKVVGYYLNVANYNAISDVNHSNYSNLEGAITANNVVIFDDDNIYGDYVVSEGSQPYYFILKQFKSSNRKSIWEGIFLDTFLESIKVEK